MKSPNSSGRQAAKSSLPKVNRVEADALDLIHMSEVNKWFGGFHVLKDINLSDWQGENIPINFQGGATTARGDCASAWHKAQYHAL